MGAKVGDVGTADGFAEGVVGTALGAAVGVVGEELGIQVGAAVVTVPPRMRIVPVQLLLP